MQLFDEIKPALEHLAQSGDLKPPEDGEPGVIFQEKQDNEKCKGQPKEGLGRVAAEALIGAATAVGAILAGPVAIGLLIAVGAGAKAGADAAETEEKHEECKQGSAQQQ